MPEVVDYKTMAYQELRRAVKAAGIIPASQKSADLIAALESQ